MSGTSARTVFPGGPGKARHSRHCKQFGVSPMTVLVEIRQHAGRGFSLTAEFGRSVEALTHCLAFCSTHTMCHVTGVVRLRSSVRWPRAGSAGAGLLQRNPSSGGQQPDHLELTTILNRGHEIFSAALIDGPRLRERRCTAAVLQHKYHDESIGGSAQALCTLPSQA